MAAKKSVAKKAPAKKKAVKKMETPVIEKEPEIEEEKESEDVGPGYEVIVGDEIVDDIEKGEERAQHDPPIVEEEKDPMDLLDWIHGGVAAIPTPEEEAELKALGEADREAARVLAEQIKEADMTPEEPEVPETPEEPEE